MPTPLDSVTCAVLSGAPIVLKFFLTLPGLAPRAPGVIATVAGVGAVLASLRHHRQGRGGEEKESREGSEEQGKERKWVQQEVSLPSYQEAELVKEVSFDRANQEPRSFESVPCSH